MQTAPSPCIHDGNQHTLFWSLRIGKCWLKHCRHQGLIFECGLYVASIYWTLLQCSDFHGCYSDHDNKMKTCLSSLWGVPSVEGSRNKQHSLQGVTGGILRTLGRCWWLYDKYSYEIIEVEFAGFSSLWQNNWEKQLKWRKIYFCLQFQRCHFMVGYGSQANW
jgi:hypothetical protein